MSIFMRIREPDDNTLVKAATEALTRPGSYMTSDDRLFWSHGLTFGQHRDSDVLDRSNYERISEDMRAEFPGDIDVQYFSHWAVGYGETLVVRVLRDPEDDITPENITGAFMVITAITDGLRCDYPVYDDSHYSQLEYDEQREEYEEVWAGVLRCWDEDEDGPEPTDAERDQIFSNDVLDAIAYDGNVPDEDRIKGFVSELRAGA
jgi:hypothetical protein